MVSSLDDISGLFLTLYDSVANRTARLPIWKKLQ